MPIKFRTPPHPSSSTGRAGPSARPASPEPGRASSTDKSDQSKSRFNIPFSPSRAASGFAKLFGGKKKYEAKEQLKQIAQEILNQVEKNIGLRGGEGLDEKTKKKLNSSLRQAMTEEEMGMLEDTLKAAEEFNKNKSRQVAYPENMVYGLSMRTKDLASGKMSKAEFMEKLKNTAQELDNLVKENNAKSAVRTQLASLKGLSPEIYGIAFEKNKSIQYLESKADLIAKCEEFAARLDSINARLKKGESHAKCRDDVKLFNPFGTQPEREAVRAPLLQLRFLKELDKEIYTIAKYHYVAIGNLESPTDTKAKFEEFSAFLKSVNERLKNGGSREKCLQDMYSFSPSPSPESQHQSSSRPRPSTRRPQSASPSEPTMPKPATTVAAYAGPRLSISGNRPAEAREHAERLKKYIGEGPLRELHSDLLALANNATEDMKNVFNKKYEKVFENKYGDNPSAFAVLGRAGLNGCGGNARASEFWSLASAHVPHG